MNKALVVNFSPDDGSGMGKPQTAFAPSSAVTSSQRKENGSAAISRNRIFSCGCRGLSDEYPSPLSHRI